MQLLDTTTQLSAGPHSLPTPDPTPRSGGQAPPTKSEESCAPVPIPAGVINLMESRIEYNDGRECRLSQRELDLLGYLTSHADRPVSRDELLADVWHVNPERTRTRTIDMHIATLRKKLRGNSNTPSPLTTVRGTGYRFSCLPEARLRAETRSKA